MTSRLWARIEGVLGFVPPIARDITANLVVEIVQPIADERDRLAAQVAELEQRQADHLAEINQTTNQLNAVHATAIEWSEHCPPDDWGMTPSNTVLANAGRYLITLIDEAARITPDNPLTSTNAVDNPKERS